MTSDEQRAREWLDANEPIFGYVSDRKVNVLAALLASRALEEAKWWNGHDHELDTERRQERLAALEQAAGRPAEKEPER